VGECGVVEAVVDKAGAIKVGEFKTACFLRRERVVVGFKFVSGGDGARGAGALLPLLRGGCEEREELAVRCANHGWCRSGVVVVLAVVVGVVGVVVHGDGGREER
jgi:hypothetical protein